MKRLFAIALVSLATAHVAHAQLNTPSYATEDQQQERQREYDRQQNAAFNKLMFDNEHAPKVDANQPRVHQPPTPIFAVATSASKSMHNVCLQIREPDLFATVYYTTDGTVPSVSSTTYTGPFCVPHHTIVRTIAIRTKRPPSEVATHVFR